MLSNTARVAAIFILCMQAVVAQVTFRITGLPSSTPPDAQIFVSGNFEGWTGGQLAYQLHKDSDWLFAITLPQMAGTIQFKFTRGSWASVEKGMFGEEIANRTYTFGGNGAIVDITIHNWADLSGIQSTAADNVSLYDDNFFIPQLNRYRKVWLYLPPDYDDNIQRSYPVLYMHDGQNLFDDSTSFAGEWHVDETLNDLFEETGFGLIVIGIENGGGTRIDEYSPWFNPQYGGGEGEEYLRFITETLKPHIDSMFRTQSASDHTGIMGSSMGGLISHYAGIAKPDVFGKIGVFSPSFSIFDSCYDYVDATGVDPETKFAFLAGGLEGNVDDRVNEMYQLMLQEGASEDLMQVTIDPSGQHNEQFWAAHFGDAIEWLFAIPSSTEPSLTNNDLLLTPNPANSLVFVRNELDQQIQSIRLISPDGRIVRELERGRDSAFNVASLPDGLYFVQTAGYLTGKLLILRQ